MAGAGCGDGEDGRAVAPEGRENPESQPRRRRVCSNNGGEARLWDPATGQPVSPVMTYGDPKQWYIDSTSFSADSRRLAILYVRSKPGRVFEYATQRWDAVTGQPLGPPQQLPAGVGFHVLSFDMRHMVVLAEDGTARLFDAVTGQRIGEPLGEPLKSPTGGISPGTGAWPSPDGDRMLFTYSRGGGEARVWDVTTGRATPPLVLDSPVKEHAFSHDGRRLLLLEETTARVWDTATGRPRTPPIRYEGAALKAVLSPDGRRLLTYSGDEATVHDAGTGRPLTPRLRHTAPLLSATFSPDGARVLTAGDDGTARLWAATAGEPPARRLEHEHRVTRATFSPDGRLLFTGGTNTAARLWDAATGQPRTPPIPYYDRGWLDPGGRRFSPDSRLLVVPNGRELRLWDTGTGQPVGAALKHDHGVWWASFSPDNRHLLTLQWGATPKGRESQAQLWDVTTGQAASASL